MTASLPITRLVNVEVDLTPRAAQAQDLNSLMIVGTSDVIDVVQRARQYSSITEVATDFGTDSEEYAAAVLWFEQSPQPVDVWIGRWADADTPGQLIGGPVSAANQLPGAWTPITDGGFLIYVNGIPYSGDGVSFASVANMNAVAVKIQTELASLIAPDPTCVWNETYQRFEIATGADGEGETVSFLEPPTATGDIVFSANPTDGSSIVLNGTAVVFDNTPTADQVQIGATLVDTLASLLAFLQASTDTQLVKFKYVSNDVDTLYLVAATSGAGGDALTTTASGSPASHGTPSGATLSGGTATDVSGMLAMRSTSSGAYVADGIDAEAPEAALVILDELYGQKWYASTVPSADDGGQLACAETIQGMTNKHLLGISTQDANVLSALSTTDIAYLVKEAGYTRTVVQYNSGNAYSVCSLFGRALTVDYNGNNTVITLMYKQEPGITPDQLTSSQATAAQDKNANVFAAYNNDTAIIQYGTMASGAWMDEMTGADWFAVTLQNALYNLLYTSPTKIPQTDSGTQLLVNVCNAVCDQAVANGWVAPGTWTSQGFGTLKSGDFMPNGYYVYAPAVATQLQADREARKSVPIKVALKLAGAVQTVDVVVNVNR